jgi:BirA family transcriptional regulator, biotin operon repressor / biotin---[acetyl-CoA-carboxylase] ligase
MTANPFRLVRLERVGSTQEAAREMVRSGIGGGTAILAGEQTAGRGMGDRTWQSPRGLGIWLTIIHRSARPKGEWPALTVAAAAGVCGAIEGAGLRPRTRWPNDVLLSGRKVAGVLADTESDAVLIGIGLNVLQQDCDFSPELRGRATSIRLEAQRDGIEPPDLETMLAEVLSQMARSLRIFESAGPDAVIPAFWERSIDRGKRVTIRLPSAMLVEGPVIGLGEIGQLLIETERGAVAVASGTVVRMEEG